MMAGSINKTFDNETKSVSTGGATVSIYGNAARGNFEWATSDSGTPSIELWAPVNRDRTTDFNLPAGRTLYVRGDGVLFVDGENAVAD